jgi:hypothetical protein
VINASCLPASKSPHVWLDRFTFDLDKPAQRSRATKNIYILGILYTLKAYFLKRKKICKKNDFRSLFGSWGAKKMRFVILAGSSGHLGSGGGGGGGAPTGGVVVLMSVG